MYITYIYICISKTGVWFAHVDGIFQIIKNTLKPSSDCWSRNPQNAWECKFSVSGLQVFLKYISQLITLNQLYFVAQRASLI